MQGEFVWHEHDETDEVFLALDGELTIDLDGQIALGAREMVTIPRGMRQRSRAERETALVLIQSVGVVNTEDADPGEFTVAPEVS